MVVRSDALLWFFRLNGFGLSGRFCGPLCRSDVRVFSRNGSKLAPFGGICGQCYLDSMVTRYDVRLSWSLPLDWRGRRDWRCLLAQDWQRVCPGMAGCWQSSQRPDSFSLRRFSAARDRARSCRSSGVRRTRFALSDAFGFTGWTVAGFEVLRALSAAGFGLAGFLVLRLGAGLSS